MASTKRSRYYARRSLNRAMQRIQDAGSDRARLLCELIVQEIQTNPDTPYDSRRENDTTGTHLRDSYRARAAGDGTGAWVVTTNRRYWRFVEFGTEEHGDAQPHIRPAVELVRRLFV